MKILKLMLCCAMLSNQTFAQNWTTLNIPNAGRYDDLFFLNDSVAWACNSQGQSYKTTNSGQSWVNYPVFPGDYLRSIKFMDADTGFCGGLDNGSYLFRSTNGGQTWTNITNKIPGLSGGICGLSCPGGKVIYGSGYFGSPAHIIKSIDGGISWQKINMSAQVLSLVDVLFTSQDTGWVSGRALQDGGGVILHTTDGGASWQTVHDTGIHGDYVWKIQRLDAQNWFASVERDNTIGAQTNILKSTDGGISWQTILVSNSYHRIQAIGFVTPQHGWAGDTRLFETTNGGQSWQDINPGLGIGYAFNRFVRISDKKAFLTGGRVYQFNAPSSAAVDPIPPDANHDFHGLTVSPNPTSDKVQISITLRQKTHVILKVYAFNGGYEELLWTGEHAEGDYLLQASLAHQPAGNYVVYLKTNHGTQTRMVTLIR